MSNKFTVYKCKYCGDHIIKENREDDIDVPLWGHIQMHHEELFEELQNLETPDMIEIAYDKMYELTKN